ncbi:MAG: hypothetical protein LBE09_01185 [Christensenellaceae bacterium]|jgi:hypothetical protein|nr:hypothetical protein [Christensenellaceae bacterium]
MLKMITSKFLIISVLSLSITLFTFLSTKNAVIKSNFIFPTDNETQTTFVGRVTDIEETANLTIDIKRISYTLYQHYLTNINPSLSVGSIVHVNEYLDVDSSISSDVAGRIVTIQEQKDATTLIEIDLVTNYVGIIKLALEQSRVYKRIALNEVITCFNKGRASSLVVTSKGIVDGSYQIILSYTDSDTSAIAGMSYSFTTKYTVYSAVNIIEFECVKRRIDYNTIILTELRTDGKLYDIEVDIIDLINNFIVVSEEISGRKFIAHHN